MSKKIGLIILVVLALSLGACTRVASVASQATATKGNNLPKAVDTNGMKVLEDAGTQTAVAQSGTPGAVETATPAPADNTTPVAMPSFTPVGQQAPAATDTPLPSPTPAVVTAPQPTIETTRPTTYTLQQGEYVYCIARRFNVNPDEVLSLNGLADSQTLYPGRTLKIPTTGNPFLGPRARRTHPATYVVQSGDSIYSIACVFGDVNPLNIAAANGLSAPYTLTVGAQINIP